MKYKTNLLMSEFVTHDVKRFILEKPKGFSFVPGQGVELAIDNDRWHDEGRPFTPTSLNEDHVLEFTIKSYPEHRGVTRALHDLRPGARLVMSETFGTIEYKGPGVFIAGGAGVTPFIAILRDLARRQQLAGLSLVFSNKTPADIIIEKELRHLLGERCLFTCTRNSAPGYDNSRIDRNWLEQHIRDFSQRFYVCGPSRFTADINEALQALGAQPDSLVFEE